MENNKFQNLTENYEYPTKNNIWDTNTTTGVSILWETTTRTSKEWFFLIFEYVQSGIYLICFLANLITIIAVFKFDYLHRKSTNLLILSLSCADGIVGESLFTLTFLKAFFSL